MGNLSDRDYNILFMMGEGCSYTEMALELGVSFSRIKSLIYELRCKLEATNNEQAIAIAYHKGILIPRVKAKVNGS